MDWKAKSFQNTRSLKERVKSPGRLPGQRAEVLAICILHWTPVGAQSSPGRKVKASGSYLHPAMLCTVGFLELNTHLKELSVKNSKHHSVFQYLPDNFSERVKI